MGGGLGAREREAESSGRGAWPGPRESASQGGVVGPGTRSREWGSGSQADLINVTSEAFSGRGCQPAPGRAARLCTPVPCPGQRPESCTHVAETGWSEPGPASSRLAFSSCALC